MSEDEIMAQVRCVSHGQLCSSVVSVISHKRLVLAGHEATAKTVSNVRMRLKFAIWELAKLPKFQERTRAEVSDALDKNSS